MQTTNPVTPLKKLFANMTPLRSTKKQEIGEHNPLDFEQFRRRVSTYSVETWYSKPHEINPLVCSKYGFVNNSNDIITCQNCRKVLCFKKFSNIKILNAAVIAFLEKMKNSHKDGCAFQNPSPNEFSEPFLENTKTEQKVQKLEVSKFYQRIESNIKENIPKLAPEFMNEFKEDDLNYIISISQEKDVKPEFILLSLFFWDISIYKEKRIKLSCEYCQSQRCCGSADIFHPLKQHRWWCPTTYKRLNPCGWKLVFEGLKSEINLPDKQSTAFEKLISVKEMLKTAYTKAMVPFSPLVMNEKEKNIEEMDKKRFKFSPPAVSLNETSKTPDTFKFGQTPDTLDESTTGVISKQLFSVDEMMNSNVDSNVQSSFSFPDLSKNDSTTKPGSFSFSFANEQKPKEVEKKQEEEEISVETKPFYELPKENNPFPFTGFSNTTTFTVPVSNSTEKDETNKQNEVVPVSNPTTTGFTMNDVPIQFSFGQEEEEDDTVFSDEEEENERILNSTTPAFSIDKSTSEQISFGFQKEEVSEDDTVWSSEDEEDEKEKEASKKTETSILAQTEKKEEEDVESEFSEEEKESPQMKKKVRKYGSDSEEEEEVEEIIVKDDGFSNDLAAQIEAYNKKLAEESNQQTKEENSEKEEDEDELEDFDDSEEAPSMKKKVRKYGSDSEEEEEEEVEEIYVENDSVSSDFLAQIEAFNKAQEEKQSIEETKTETPSMDESKETDQTTQPLPKEEEKTTEEKSTNFNFSFQAQPEEKMASEFSFSMPSTTQPISQFDFSGSEKKETVPQEGFSFSGFGETTKSDFNFGVTQQELETVPSVEQPKKTETSITSFSASGFEQAPKEGFSFSTTSSETPKEIQTNTEETKETDVINPTTGFTMNDVPIQFSFGQEEEEDDTVFSDEEEENERILNSTTPAFSIDKSTSEQISFGFQKEEVSEDDTVWSSEDEETINKEEEKVSDSGSEQLNKEEGIIEISSEEDQQQQQQEKQEEEGEIEYETEEGDQEDDVSTSSEKGENKIEESFDFSNQTKNFDEEEEKTPEKKFNLSNEQDDSINFGSNEHSMIFDNSQSKSTQSTLNLEDFKNKSPSTTPEFSQDLAQSTQEEEEEVPISKELWKDENPQEIKKDDVSEDLRKEEEQNNAEVNYSSFTEESASENEFGKKRKGTTIIKSRKKRKKK